MNENYLEQSIKGTFLLFLRIINLTYERTDNHYRVADTSNKADLITAMKSSLLLQIWLSMCYKWMYNYLVPDFHVL